MVGYLLLALVPAASGVLRSRSRAHATGRANPPSIEHGGEISERGMAMMIRIYGTELLPRVFDAWGSLRCDVVFLEASIIYGLYLSDHSMLTEIQSECVIVASMLCTGFDQPSLWHLRGLCRLLGARGNTVAGNKAVVDKLQRFEDAIKECVRFYKMEDKAKLKGWPNVADAEKELGGFGNDPVDSLFRIKLTFLCSWRTPTVVPTPKHRFKHKAVAHRLSCSNLPNGPPILPFPAFAQQLQPLLESLPRRCSLLVPIPVRSPHQLCPFSQLRGGHQFHPLQNHFHHMLYVSKDLPVFLRP